MGFVSKLVNVHEHSNLVVADDWAPAFAAAIDEAVSTRREGVFVPAYGTDYTVRKPARGVPSIDLRGRSNFVLVGEGDGSRIRMLGSGMGGSWNMIMIGGNCVDVTVRNLYLDGDRSNLTELDPGQHTHTIQVGGMDAGGSARRVRILDCTMTDMDGDGVAIAALEGPFGGGNDVSVVDMIGCRFLNCGRSGVSNQRSAEFVKIHQCLFEGTSDQDIDFEPTGAELGSGPRRYSIIGNTMVRSGTAASVTLSGVGGDIPARDNIFAFNQIYGGRVGMLDTEHVLIVGNYVEGALGDADPVLQLRGKSEGARISLNHLVRPPGSVPGKALNISSRELVFTLRGVDHTTSTLIVPGHGRATGTGPVTLVTTGTLPACATSAASYWLIRIDGDTLKLAISKANAIAGTAVGFTDDGTGFTTVKFPPSVTLKGFDHATGTVTVPGHGRATGTGPVTLSTTGTLPAASRRPPATGSSASTPTPSSSPQAMPTRSPEQPSRSLTTGRGAMHWSWSTILPVSTCPRTASIVTAAPMGTGAPSLSRMLNSARSPGTRSPHTWAPRCRPPSDSRHRRPSGLPSVTGTSVRTASWATPTAMAPTTTASLWRPSVYRSVACPSAGTPSAGAPARSA